MDNPAIDASDAGSDGPLRQSLEEMESGMFCIKTLCEHEGVGSMQRLFHFSNIIRISYIFRDFDLKKKFSPVTVISKF